MIGVFINAAAIIVGGLMGLLFHKGISDKISNALMTSIGLCVIAIGITGILKGQNTLVLILGAVCGTFVGTLTDIDNLLNKLGDWVESRFASKATPGSLTQGFVAGSLLMCVGAMGIVGSLNAGLNGDISTLLTKSVLDFISAALLTISLGPGVLLSSVVLFVVQGSIVMLAQVLYPLLSDAMIAEMICIGSVMILALGFNLIGVTKIKVANLLPGIVFVPVFYGILCYFWHVSM